jgi:hypothetical protein
MDRMCKVCCVAVLAWIFPNAKATYNAGTNAEAGVLELSRKKAESNVQKSVALLRPKAKQVVDRGKVMRFLRRRRSDWKWRPGRELKRNSRWKAISSKRNRVDGRSRRYNPVALQPVEQMASCKKRLRAFSESARESGSRSGRSLLSGLGRRLWR